MNKRLLVVLLLGFSAGLPLALVTSTLQAWYADVGMSVLATGMLSLVGMPYVYRVAWGPLLDRYTLTFLGKRRSWIFIMQVALLLGFNILSWLTPQQSPHLIAYIALLLACFSATQDVAIDAQRTESLPIIEHGLGASLYVCGYRVALLITGGLALVMAHHWGWAVTYRLCGAMMLIGLFTTLWSEEPTHPPAHEGGFIATFVLPIKDLFSRNDIAALLLFVFFYKLGEAFTTTTSGIVMPFLIQGLGFSLDTIGYVNKILGIGAILAGGFAAGLLLMRWSLYRALLVFGLIQAATNLLFVFLALAGKNLPLFATAVISDNFAAGMGSTALVALFMRLVNRQFTATQFSFLVGISMIPRVLSGPFAALLQIHLGWVGVYQLAFLLSLCFLPFLSVLRHRITSLSTIAKFMNA